ncbi:alpha/beta hydrolase [Mycobacterium intermedium]|uniref:Alpha/beta hydrolase n=1 Tax=Mycobacterium intermedium TaxID=28445 RepID=A0A1E3SHG0_MYCIE|nr:alpha/beta fold hydrolase [Mycobacterium intermedium]MCV6963274.1 alpha/beta fold hydrolase [Mycobacterium intermedium]ODR01571.1 alpha/beta hydrolase [Mycobacterium intermedium]OPE47451.1 alpha/beta hydrolase [Mycobacterium intermedium]ORA95972.1 alpha/beta hydrolase [Mycobacterium intermedium]
MEQFSRGQLVFDVRDSGPEDGPVVVLLHGHPQTNSAWDGVIPLLTARGYRCLAPNQRGISPGARPPRRRDYRVSELVDDVGALIDASGAHRVHLVGHDWGALVAWAFAASHPDRLITLTALSGPHPRALRRALLTGQQGMASWYVYFYQLPRIPERVYLGRDGKGARLSAMMQAGGQRLEFADRDARALAEPGAYTAALNWYRAMPWSGRVGPVSVPTLYVWGDNDPYILDRAAHTCGNHVTGFYRFEILRRAGHWLPDEHPDTVADLLLEFFATRRA